MKEIRELPPEWVPGWMSKDQQARQTEHERRRRREDRRWLLDRREEMRGPVVRERRMEWTGRRAEDQINHSR
jgi:hypothetical protein